MCLMNVTEMFEVTSRTTIHLDIKTLHVTATELGPYGLYGTPEFMEMTISLCDFFGHHRQATVIVVNIPGDVHRLDLDCHHISRKHIALP